MRARFFACRPTLEILTRAPASIRLKLRSVTTTDLTARVQQLCGRALLFRAHNDHNACISTSRTTSARKDSACTACAPSTLPAKGAHGFARTFCPNTLRKLRDQDASDFHHHAPNLRALRRQHAAHPLHEVLRGLDRFAPCGEGPNAVPASQPCALVAASVLLGWACVALDATRTRRLLRSVQPRPNSPRPQLCGRALLCRAPNDHIVAGSDTTRPHHLHTVPH